MRTGRAVSRRGHHVKRSNFTFTSESVSEGHPDKVCDRISDEVVDLFFREAEASGMPASDVRVACETLATTNRVVIAGEVRGPDGLCHKQSDGTVKVDEEKIIADYAEKVIPAFQ